MTDENPLDHMQEFFGNAVVTLTKWNDNLTIKDMRSFAKDGGKLAMAALCKLADQYRVTLELYAMGYAHVPTDQLVPFYERFGFRRVDDYEDDGVDMIRAPN